MDAPESGRSRSKRDAEDRIETRESRAEDEEDWDGSDRKKHRSSKSRKHSTVEEVQDPESGKKKSSSEWTDDRKKLGSLNRAGSGDEDDHDVRRESRSKIPRKSLEERGEVRPSEGYHDRGLEGSRKSRDEEHEWDSSKKTSTKPSGHDSSQGKTRSKADSSHEGEPEKGQDRDPKYSDKKESSREKGNPQHKRWDETEAGKRADESSSADRRASDYNKHGSTRERQPELRIESGEARGRIVDLSGDKGARSDNKEEKRVDREGNRSRGRSEGQDDDSRAVTTPWEVKSDVNRDEKQAKIRERSEDVDPNAHRYSTKPYSEKAEKHRRDEVEGRERSVNIDEDGHGRLRDRSGREVRKAKRSRTPERSERYHRDMDEHDRGYSESETERSMGMRGKEREKEGYRDDRSTKGKDASWSEKNREREGSKDHWRRSHTRPDGKDGDIEFDHAKEWDSQRRDQDRDSQRRDQDRDSQRRNQDRDSQRRDQDRDSQRRDQDRDSQRRDQDRDSQRRDQDRDSQRRDQDRDLQRREQDRDSQRRDPDRDAQRRDQDRDSLRRDQDRDSLRREQDRDVQRRDQDRDSQRRDQDRDLQRRDQDRVSVYRKDTRIRSEGGKANFMDKSDSIEIRPNKNLDFGREESVASFLGRRTEAVSQQDFASGPTSDEEWGYPPEDRGKMAYGYGDDSQEKFQDDGLSMDQNSVRNSLDAQVGKGRGQKPATNPNRPGAGQGASSGMHPPLGNQGSGPLNRGSQQGQKGGRQGRGGRGRLNGRESQRIGLPLPMMGSPFGHLGLPPGTMQPIGPNIAHSPGPPIGPNVFIPPFPGPLVWPGARGVDMNMLAVPPNLPPIPPGPAGPRFAPNMGSAPNHAMYFNQPGPGRGVAPNVSGPGFNAMGPASREMQHDKPPIGWSQTRSSGPSGKAPSRGEQNDYSQNFVDTGMRPQNFIRELELTSTVEDYPKLRELIQRKDDIVAKAASPPMYYKCDLREHVLSPEFFGTKFDVILVDPPWEEYVHRAPGVTDHLEYWTFEEIQNLKIEAIADTPSFIFLWVGDGVGLEQGRQCLKKWGFRRCEDICWVKTNKKNATPGLRHDSHTLLQHSKEHCLMGIKGTVRRSTDGHIIHANIDTDIIIAEEPPDGSTKKPDDMYRIIEHFALGRRRLELFGEDHNIRSGWLTVGKGLSSSNFNPEAYIRNFADKDGKVWQGGGGRNPAPEAPHLVLTTPEIEGLRPKSPPAKNQQQQSMAVVTTGGSSNRRPSGNSPQNNSASSFSGMNQDLSMSEPGTAPWASSPMGGLRGLEGGGGSDDKFYDGYGFNATCAQVVGDHIEFDPHRTLNMM